MHGMANRTYAILCDVLKAEKLSIAKACEWFGKIDIHVRRDILKTGVIKFILDNRNEWSK